MTKPWFVPTMLATALLGGCAGLVPPTEAYDGPVRDKGELSVIKTINQFMSGSTDITIFDGKSGQFFYREVHALPGKHNMTVRVFDSARLANYHGWTNLTVETEAGRTYFVHGALDVLQSNPPKGKVYVWITQEGSEQVIAGSPPPQK